MNRHLTWLKVTVEYFIAVNSNFVWIYSLNNKQNSSSKVRSLEEDLNN